MGCGPQHREIGTPISTDNASWGGSQHREFQKKKFYRQCKLGTIKKYFFFITQCPTHFPKY
ncbi:TPA: hypothetical protein I2T72_06910 [Staphylococcus aureus]|nr:hypothetical protein [Staphylococcus aureus]HAR7136515.1 hypothetical protein [Staphylococcus aureus]HAR7148834.1 hypothetical protein [Staphylococcus aureus]HAR7194291.1 hypothetical protein [Staphylococcus aureus]HAR7214468.1 hypothetical protein [Staphylococcus aureus]